MAPFAIALCLMALIALMEIVGALIGILPSSLLDSLLPDFEVDADVDVDMDVDLDFDADADIDFDAEIPGALEADAPNVPNAPTAGPLSQLLAWLCVGKVPVLVLLVAFLTAFGLSGFILQSTLQSSLGFYLPAILAAVPAFMVALPATRYLGLGLSKVMPKEHSEASSKESFIGKVAVITRGEARRDLPAEAKLTDRHGQAHYVLVIPDTNDHIYAQGTEVIIVSRQGSRYAVIENTAAALSTND